MLGQILNIDRAEVAQTHVQRDLGRVDTLDFHTLQEVLREVQTCGRGSHGTLVLSEDGLVALLVDLLDLLAYPTRQRSLAQLVESLLELVVVAVEQEAQRTTARSGVVDHLSHQQVVIAEIEFVTDTDFACRIDQHVPQTLFAVQLTQQEDFDLCAGLLLVAIEACGEYFGIVEDKDVVGIEVVDYIFESFVFDCAFGAIDDHQTRVVAVIGRILCQHFGRKRIAVLRKFHIVFVSFVCCKRQRININNT